MKGTEAFPSSINMVQDSAIQATEALVNRLLDGSEDIFLVSVKIKPTNNIKVYLDADSGLSIEKCIKINRALYKTIEEEGWYPDGNFSLEVSSPGVDEPLKMFRQYKKNIGRKVEVQLNDGTKKEGKLIAATEEAVSIEYTEGKNKKAVVVTQDIAFADIKQTTVIISF
ncbi:MAG: ribosome assembly cofactor RimP [Ferruginibacter sp.]